jgi:amino acid transporter
VRREVWSAFGAACAVEGAGFGIGPAPSAVLGWSARKGGASVNRIPTSPLVPRRGVRTVLRSRFVLFVAFAFAVMAAPVSSVAYAIEAAARALGNDLALLFPTMLVVIGIIGLVIANYHQLVGVFPEGGGAAAAAGTAFGEGWAFIPLGALVVDFVLTIAVSIAASSSAIIAYFPTVAGLGCQSLSACSCSSPGSHGSVIGAASCSPG